MADRLVLIADLGGTPDAGLAAAAAVLPGVDLRSLPVEDILLASTGIGPVATVLVDANRLDRHETHHIAALRAAFPDAALIVVSPPPGPEAIRGLLRMGVQDWLPKPLNPTDLAEALNRDFRHSASQVARVHAVMSAVGGAGATTVALSMADLLAQERAHGGDSVALVDLDFSLGACGYMLNLTGGFPLDSVIVDPRRIDAELLALIRQRHPRGFDVYSFANRALVTHVNCYEFVLRLMEVLVTQHSHIILDVPYYEADWRPDVLAGVDSITVVGEVNLPVIKHTLDLLQSLSVLPRAAAMTRLLLNKDRQGFLRGHHIAVDTLTGLFGTTPFGFLPKDSETLLEAMDRGIPPAEVNAGSAFVTALRRHVTQHLADRDSA